MDDLWVSEKQVDLYLKKNDRTAAIRLLTSMILKCAKERNFLKAEALQDRLFAIEPMAVAEFVKSSEAIEKSKLAAIDSDHRQIWADLYGDLTPEETIALFYNLKAVSVAADQILFQQGGSDAKLYFIESGQLSLFFRKENQSVFLKTLSRGDIAGQNTFFGNSVCTATLASFSGVRYRVIGRDIFFKWQTELPSLAAKLKKYCRQRSDLSSLLRARGIDRRKYHRYGTSGEAAVKIRNDLKTASTRTYKGEIADISSEGLSVIFSASSRLATSLVGRKIKIRFLLPQLSADQVIQRDGTVVTVKQRPFNELVVGLRCDSTTNHELIDKIEKLRAATTE